jgi:hypothetical protein
MSREKNPEEVTGEGKEYLIRRDPLAFPQTPSLLHHLNLSKEQRDRPLAGEKNGNK